jgi:hypothetical protein
LCPPAWQYGEDSPAQRLRWRDEQRTCWDWYVSATKAAGPFTHIVVNGDAIDGLGYRNAGKELLTTDRLEQVQIAATCIRQAATKGTKIVILRGTPYHTGTEEDFEDALGGEVDAVKVGNHEWLDIGGKVFDFKHTVGGSQIPHGRHTALAREALWNLLWSAREEAPKADVIVRSHVHYHAVSAQPGWMAVTTPALQGFGSAYGVKMCSGTVDFGFLTFDVDGSHRMKVHLARIEEMLPKVLVL